MKFYFENTDSEICYNESYFQDLMKESDLSEIEVLEAIPFRSNKDFWCKFYGVIGEQKTGECGKFCEAYSPRNHKNGCCKYYTNKMYEHGNKTKIISK